MKNIKDMSIDEMTSEMRTYECQKDKGYAFISYSHRDCEKVYPLVLSWMRAGYNIYIDLDFAFHGSDSNWINLMTRALCNNQCCLAICFGSVHYTYSYASLLELLTIRSKKVTRLHNKVLAVDYYVIGEIPMDDHAIREKYKAEYERYFQKLKQNMGDDFSAQSNQKEFDVLKKGLEDWFSSKENPFQGDTAEEWIDYLSEAYTNGYLHFFPMISELVKKWLMSQDLIGNYYSLDTDAEIQYERFSKQKVEKRIQDDPACAETAKATDVPTQDGARAMSDYLHTIPLEHAYVKALQGDPQAQFDLGGYYEKGEGVAQDLTQAAAWYEKAAAQGHAGAQKRLETIQ